MGSSFEFTWTTQQGELQVEVRHPLVVSTVTEADPAQNVLRAIVTLRSSALPGSTVLDERFAVAVPFQRLSGGLGLLQRRVVEAIQQYEAALEAEHAAEAALVGPGATRRYEHTARTHGVQRVRYVAWSVPGNLAWTTAITLEIPPRVTPVSEHWTASVQWEPAWAAAHGVDQEARTLGLFLSLGEAQEGVLALQRDLFRSRYKPLPAGQIALLLGALDDA